MSTANGSGTKLCPYCAENIKVEAVKCRHCGSMLNAAPIPASFPVAPVGMHEDKLEGYWYAIIWGSLIIPFGVWVIVLLSSIMFYMWKKTSPKKAKTINNQGWLAFLASHLLWGLIWCGLNPPS